MSRWFLGKRSIQMRLATSDGAAGPDSQLEAAHTTTPAAATAMSQRVLDAMRTSVVKLLAAATHPPGGRHFAPRNHIANRGTALAMWSGMSFPSTSSGPRARARAAGIGSLCDSELLALLIGRGGGDQRLTDSLLDEAGDIEGLARMGPARIGELAGMGQGSAWRIEAAFELGRRLQLRRAMPRAALSHPEAIATLFTARIGALEHEQMWVLSLDGRNRLRGARCVAQGGSHALAVGAREILNAAVRDGASGFVLVHNHPSGSPEPSGADVNMTHAVSRAADVLGIPLLDHVVVTASGAYVSMLERGLLDQQEGSDAPTHELAS